MAVYLAALWTLFTVLPQHVLSLQVTPGSPCAELCIDEGAHNQTDPQSYTTDGKDIVCDDFQFSSDSAGKKFQSCMTCLQGSTYVKGSESDLASFLYNLRYSFDYCTFGDMNASAVNSNPCTTSEGCGRLTDALRKDIVNSTDPTQYGYCDADGQAIHGDAFSKCHSCVSAEAARSYVSNFLVAIGIACDQRPAPGRLLGLNETVFTKHTVQAIDPSDLDSSSSRKTALLPATAIVGISVGGLVLVLAALGCGYMQYRKRKNRQRASGWSFRCQAASGSLPPRHVLDEEEAKRARFHEAMGERSWTSPSESRVTGLIPDPPASTMSGGVAAKSAKKDAAGVTSIVTQFPPRPAAQTSGRSFTSPVIDEHATPSSATSVRSTKPLLHGDSPALHSARSFSGTYGHSVGLSRAGGSPQAAQSGASGWEEQQRTASSGSRTLTGSPAMARQVEVRIFPTTFPPPPPRR